MAIVTIAELKTYFETGDRPTQQQFVNLIDTLATGGVATPNLQQVTTAGFTTSTKIASSDGGLNYSVMNNGYIDISTGNESVRIGASLVTSPYDVQLPDKLSGTETFAMLSDIGAGSGDVVGPASAVNNNIAIFNTTTGKLIKDSGISISTSTADIASSVKVPVWTAIVTYVTGLGYLLASTAASTYQAILTAANMHTYVDSLTALTTPVDADRLLIVDNSASLAKKITWTNIKATLKTYFDTLYQATLVSGTNIKSVEGSTLLGSTPLVISREIQIACSDETTALTTGTAKVTFRAPRAMVVTGVRASLTTAQSTGSIITVDINDSGTSILSTKLTIDNTEKTSVTAATAPVISDSAIADDAEITIDIDQVGDGTAKGLKITIQYTI